LTETPPLETDRLRLAPLRIDDAEEMAGVMGDPRLYDFIGGAPPTPMELRHLYERWIAGPPRDGEAWHNWAVRLVDGGGLVGHVQATVTAHGALADIAWLIGRPWQGRGYAIEAALAMIRWLEDSGVGTITAHVNPPHRASARVAERAGLEPTEAVEAGEVVWARPARLANRDATRET
jgi:RimJ/RimL family protein N-acetyltransferase